MKFKSILPIALTTALSLTLFTGCASTDEVSFPDPEKTITLIVPQGAGGGTDTQARQLVEAMKSVSGNNNIIVENVTGGSTGTGTTQVINSEADGYTLLMYGTYVICGTMTGYTDGFEQLDFITGLSMEPFVLAVKADSPYETLEDYILAAQADKGQLTLGNAGATATTGVLAYGLNNALEEPFNVVSFNGGAELIPAVLGGHCDAGIFSQSEVLSNLDGLKPLVFFAEGNSILEELAEVPNLDQAGYGDLVVPGGCFRGITAPKDTPDDVKAYLADLLEESFNTELFQGWLTEQGLLADYSSLGDFEAYNAEIVETMKPIIQATGLAAGIYAE
ncbi:MAG: tripartite tricarboxylate transporter substrate binding protein [Eubacteriales bacterium]